MFSEIPLRNITKGRVEVNAWKFKSLWYSFFRSAYDIEAE